MVVAEVALLVAVEQQSNSISTTIRLVVVFGIAVASEIKLAVATPTSSAAAVIEDVHSCYYSDLFVITVISVFQFLLLLLLLLLLYFQLL